MKVLGNIIIFLLFLLCGFLGFAGALEVPDHPAGHITDLTPTLSASEISFLEQKLINYDKQTTNQIAVLVITSLEGDNLEDYSIRLADKWKIGQQGKDNGIIILIVKNDRKIRIEVGYGLEGVLPDGLAGSIIRDEIAPFFRKNQFFEGINQGIDAIISKISPDLYYIAPKPKKIQISKKMDWIKLMFIGILVLFVALPIFIGIFFGGYWEWVAEKAKRPSGLGVWAYVVEFIGVGCGCILLFCWGKFYQSSLIALIGGVLFLIGIIVGILDQHKIRKSKQGDAGVGYGASGFSGDGFSFGGFSGGGGGFGGGGASGGW
jgi:uncharacterized protein